MTSWLIPCPGVKISGGKILTSKSRRSTKQAATLLRLSAVKVGKTDSALGVFYRRLEARAGKAKAVTATARKLAVLFYNNLRHGMAYNELGSSYYEVQYRNPVDKGLRKRARQFGFELHETVEARVS